MTTIQRSATLATLGRRHDSDLRDRIADGGARRLPGGSSLDVDARFGPDGSGVVGGKGMRPR